MYTRAAGEANGATAQSRECTVDAEIDKRETEKNSAARQFRITFGMAVTKNQCCGKEKPTKGSAPERLGWGRKFGHRESAPERLGSAGATKSETSLEEETGADRWQRNVTEEKGDGMGGRLEDGGGRGGKEAEGGPHVRGAMCGKLKLPPEGLSLSLREGHTTHDRARDRTKFFFRKTEFVPVTRGTAHRTGFSKSGRIHSF